MFMYLSSCHHYVCFKALNEDVTKCMVMILSFRTKRSGQTVQNQNRLLLEEQSDQGLHCLPFHFIFLVNYPKIWPLFEF